MKQNAKTPNIKAKQKKENKKTNSDNNELITVETKVELIFLGEFFNIHTMQMHPITKKFIEREAVKLKQWADQDESLNLYDFTDCQGYDPNTFYNWCKIYPELHQSHEYALRRIGSRRQLGAMTRRFTEATVHRTLGYYDPIWRQQTQELARLKDEVAQNETKVIVIERFPELPMSDKTPAQVAAAVHKATGDGREYGPQGPWKKLQNREV